MKKRNTVTSVALLVITGMVMLCGCTAQEPVKTGFLSDYSKLTSVSNTSYRYIEPQKKIVKYSKFIIDPVIIQSYTGEKTAKLSKEDQDTITTYMHDAMVKAIDGRYPVVNQPGPGVARMKVAITDLKKSKIVQNVIPISKIVGTGLGGASVEAELVDSVTNEQLAAVVESQVGQRLSLDGYSTWGDAKAIMDRWAQRFRQRLDEFHSHK
jgi:hypothetical protein